MLRLLWILRQLLQSQIFLLIDKSRQRTSAVHLHLLYLLLRRSKGNDIQMWWCQLVSVTPKAVCCEQGQGFVGILNTVRDSETCSTERSVISAKLMVATMALLQHGYLIAYLTGESKENWCTSPPSKSQLVNFGPVHFPRKTTVEVSVTVTDTCKNSIYTQIFFCSVVLPSIMTLWKYQLSATSLNVVIATSSPMLLWVCVILLSV